MTTDEFTRRVEAIRPVLYRVCCTQLSIPADREDAIQEAVFRAWRKRDLLRQTRYFNTWFIRILINACHDIQKRQGRVTPMEALPEPASPADARLEGLRDALNALDEKQRLCVLLHYIEGYGTRSGAESESCYPRRWYSLYRTGTTMNLPRRL
ncbi:MAG: sigma-70 family RNA polymerase sigma factor [Clostridia bacterium]|nr:sigma-70 family RNA polymerase sigma factor [Clostridia bacterium]